MPSFWKYDVPVANQSFFDNSGFGHTVLAYSAAYQPLGNDEFIIQAGQLADLGAECRFFMQAGILTSTAGAVVVRLYDLTNSRFLCYVATTTIGEQEVWSETPVDYFATLSGDIRARFEYTNTVPVANGVAGVSYVYVKLKRR